MEENSNGKEASHQHANDEALQQNSDENSSCLDEHSPENENLQQECVDVGSHPVDGRMQEVPEEHPPENENLQQEHADEGSQLVDESSLGEGYNGQPPHRREDDHHGGDYMTEEEEYPDAEIEFEETYACRGLSSIGKEHLEQGDQVVLPASALERLLKTYVDYPMLFQIRSDFQGRSSHCGVSEFTAEVGFAHLPAWMMDNLELQEGDTVTVRYRRLEKGTYIKLQPHSMKFLRLSNPKAALEETLSANFFCLTSGDTIKINYNNRDYYINVMETKPSNAISIIDTDCEVEFAAPLDFVEPVGPVESEAATSNAAQKFVPFTGQARRLDEKPSAELPTESEKKSSGMAPSMVTEAVSNSDRFSQNTDSGLSELESSRREKVDQEEWEEGTLEQEVFVPFKGKKYSLLD